ncbi:MAG: magnesium transporter [Deltaproteobacteria bacterium]|nr:magnesium transporter [Deltaproteobacteria bacterium]
MYGEVVHENIKRLLEERDLRKLRDLLIAFRPADIADLINEIPDEDKALVFRILPRELATDTFEYLTFDRQKSILSALGQERVAILLNGMDPDDRTALLEEFPAAAARQLVLMLSKEERAVALSLLGYPENSVGRLMTPDYIAVKEDWTINDVLSHIRKDGKDTDNMHVLYVVDAKGKLIDDLRIRDLLLASPEKKVSELLNHKFLALNVRDDQEKAVEMFKKYDRTALPVIDPNGAMLGILTVDDVLDVAEEEATEDIQKLGAVEALEEPYINTPIFELIRKRARWLVVLFIGEMLTATAMGYFESEIERAVILALFIPLIISSGGNSGSQAATLIIRSLAIGEISVSDWWKVFKRESFSGLILGSILGAFGFLRVTLWAFVGSTYGPHWLEVATVVALSLVGVVVWGVLTGAMLPFILKRLGADPATSSAPFVATLVDVTGLVIYFSIASYFLGGLLL